MMVVSERVALMLQNSTKSRHITHAQCHDLLTSVVIINFVEITELVSVSTFHIDCIVSQNNYCMNCAFNSFCVEHLRDSYHIPYIVDKYYLCI